MATSRPPPTSWLTHWVQLSYTFHAANISNGTGLDAFHTFWSKLEKVEMGYVNLIVSVGQLCPCGLLVKMGLESSWYTSNSGKKTTKKTHQIIQHLFLMWLSPLWDYLFGRLPWLCFFGTDQVNNNIVKDDHWSKWEILRYMRNIDTCRCKTKPVKTQEICFANHFKRVNKDIKKVLGPPPPSPSV